MAFMVAKLMIVFIFGLLSFILFFSIEFVSIRGESMTPTIHEGDVLVILKILYPLTLNDIYVYKSPISRHDVVKRLTDIDEMFEKDCCWLYFLGDNPAMSSDSRNYGYVSEKAVIGKVIYHIKKKQKS